MLSKISIPQTNFIAKSKSRNPFYTLYIKNNQNKKNLPHGSSHNRLKCFYQLLIIFSWMYLHMHIPKSCSYNLKSFIEIKSYANFNFAKKIL